MMREKRNKEKIENGKGDNKVLSRLIRHRLDTVDLFYPWAYTENWFRNWGPSQIEYMPKFYYHSTFFCFYHHKCFVPAWLNEMSQIVANGRPTSRRYFHFMWIWFSIKHWGLFCVHVLSNICSVEMFVSTLVTQRKFTIVGSCTKFNTCSAVTSIIINF